MKIPAALSLGISLATASISTSSANLHWDFTQGGTLGWNHYVFDYVEQTSPSTRAPGGPIVPVTSIATSFKVLTGEGYGVENSNGALVADGAYAGITGLGDLTSYAGGSLNFVYDEYKDTPWKNEGGTPPSNNNAFVFLSGTVGGQSILLRHQLNYSFDVNEVQNFTLDLSAANFERAEYVSVYEITETLSVNTYGSLSDADFAEFLANVDGLYFRMSADYATVNDGTGSEWVTKLSSVSITEAALIPEPATVSLLLPGLFLAFRRRRS